MDKKTAGLLGAMAGLAAMGSAQAATSPPLNAADAMQAASYADLLTPVPNAAAVLRADDAARMQEPLVRSPAELELADYYYGPPPAYHHHHHHHHHHHQAYYHHHHHHHHHHSAFVGVPGVGGVVVSNH